MARKTFPDEGSRLVYSITGGALRSSVSTQMKVYSDSGASSLADIQTTGGATISGSVITVDSGSNLPLFKGPNDDSDTLYVRKADGTGSITTIYARVDDRIDAIASTYAIRPALSDSGLWVSPLGSDSNDGLSAGSAKKTVQAAITAAAASTGGTINVLAGTHNGAEGTTAGEIIVPQSTARRWRIVGQGGGLATSGQGTILKWTSDLGADKFAIKSSAPASSTYLSIENLELLGPGNGTITVGVAPASMDGLLMSSRVTIQDCVVRGFRAGIKVTADHVRAERTAIASNYYGMLWDDRTTSGDAVVYDCNITGNSWASVGIGVGSGSSTQGELGGTTFLHSHFGFSPYGFYIEPGRVASSNAMSSVQFLGSSFEAVSHGGIVSPDSTAKCTDLLFVECGNFASSTFYVVDGEPFEAIFKVGDAARWTFLNCAPPIGGGRYPTESVFKGASLTDFAFLQGGFKANLTDVIAQGLYYLQATGSISGRWDDGTLKGKIGTVNPTSQAITAKQLLGWVNSNGYRQLTTGLQFAGVALMDVPANSPRYGLLLATEGPGISVDTTAAIAGNAQVMVDEATPTKIVTYDNGFGRHLGIMAAGVSTSGAAATTIDLHPSRTMPLTKGTVTGSRGGNAALADLLTELAALGLITDSSSA